MTNINLDVYTCEAFELPNGNFLAHHVDADHW
jgi:hypothetical protein